MKISQTDKDLTATIEVSEEMLCSAMKEAVNSGIFQKYSDEETYLKNWKNMKKILTVAIAAQ